MLFNPPEKDFNLAACLIILSDNVRRSFSHIGHNPHDFTPVIFDFNVPMSICDRFLHVQRYALVMSPGAMQLNAPSEFLYGA